MERICVERRNTVLHPRKSLKKSLNEPRKTRRSRKVFYVTEKSRGFGGAEGDRTLDLRIANAALSQLSYVPRGAQL